MAFSINIFFSQHACGYIIRSAADLPNSFFPFHFRIDIVFVIDWLAKPVECNTSRFNVFFFKQCILTLAARIILFRSAKTKK